MRPVQVIDALVDTPFSPVAEPQEIAPLKFELVERKTSTEAIAASSVTLKDTATDDAFVCVAVIEPEEAGAVVSIVNAARVDDV